MTIEYCPNKKIIFDEVVVVFNECRYDVRKKINKSFEEDNQVIDLGEKVDPLNMRRDIYENISSSRFSFFLNYDKSDTLVEVEVYECKEIKVLNVCFKFEDDLDLVVLRLSEYSKITILSEGEILFNDLKMAVSNKRKMGGEGNSIAYVYCTADISHLLI